MTRTQALDSPTGVLAALADRNQGVRRLEVEQLELAVQWAIMHPVESLDQAATVPGTEGELAIAGPGAPLVAEFCVPELALVLGMSTDAGRTYLGDAVEIRYRLPKLWTEVTHGRVMVWKARKIAQATKHLTRDAAAYVDTHLAPVAQRCSFAQLERTVETALRLFDPAEAEKRRRDAADHRHFDIDTRQVSFNGLVHVDADLDLRDALDLNDALTTGAQALAELGCEESLDVRRSLAAGALARREQHLDLEAPKRDLTIYVHLGEGSEVAGVENTRSSTTLGQVQDWCTRAGTRVTVRPVIDLNEDLSTESYELTDRMREQVALTNPCCVFVNCTRPSRRLDNDHLDNWDHTNTHSLNLAPLCRFHHRLKTHGGWTVKRTGPTTFVWTSPQGYTYEWDTTHAQHSWRQRHTA